LLGDWTHEGDKGKGGREAGATVNLSGWCGVQRQQEDFTIISFPPPRESGEKKYQNQCKALGKKRGAVNIYSRILES